MLGLPVIKVLVALKAMVDRSVNFHCWQEFVVLNATVISDVNSNCWQDFGRPEN